MCDEAAHVLCPACWNACGTGGHRPCFRCAGEPERCTWSERGPSIPDAPPVIREAAAETRARDAKESPRPAQDTRAIDDESLRGEILALLREYRVPLTSLQIREKVPLDPAALRRLLAPLIERGVVGRIGERRGTRYYWTGAWLSGRASRGRRSGSSSNSPAGGGSS